MSADAPVTSWLRRHRRGVRVVLYLAAVLAIVAGVLLATGKHKNGALALVAWTVAGALISAAVASAAGVLDRMLTPRERPKEPMPKQAVLRGRADSVDRVVRLLTADPAPTDVVVYGLAGIGKSALCTRVLDDDRVVQRFGDGRAFVRCEDVDSVDALMSAIAASVGVSTDETKRRLRNRVSEWLDENPCLLYLDNLETPLDADPATRQLVEELVEKPRAAVLASLRRADEPDRSELPLAPIGLAPLSLSDSEAVFVDAAGPERLTPSMKAVVADLGGMPLAIVLLALTALKAELSEVDAVAAAYSEHRAELVHADGSASQRTLSVRASVELSMQGRRMTEAARDLMALLAWLPAGIAWNDVPSLTGDGHAPADDLMAVGLASRDLTASQDRRLLTLPPIRDHVLRTRAPDPGGRDRARALYLGILSEHDARAASRAVSEAANIAVIVDEDPGPATQKIDRLLAEGDLQLQARAVTLATATFERAAEEARKLGDVDRLARAALGMSGGVSRLVVGLDWSSRPRRKLLREAHDALLRGGGDPVVRLRVIQRLLRELRFVATAEAQGERARLVDEARELRGGARDPVLALEMGLDQLKDASPRDAPPAARLALADEVLRSARESGDAPAEFEVHWAKAVALFEDGRPGDGSGELDECERLAAALGDDELRLRAEQARRTLAIFRGELDAVQGFWAEDAIVATDEAVRDRQRRQLLHQRVFYCYYRDCLDEVAPEVEAMVDERKRGEMESFGYVREEQLALNDFQWWPTWRANLAMVTTQSDPDRARAVLRSLGTSGYEDILPQEYWLYVIAMFAIALGEVLRPGEDDRHADALVAILSPYADRCVVSWGMAMNFGSIQAIVGTLRARQRNWAEALPDLDAGLERNRAMGAGPEVVRTLIARAEALRGRAAPGDGDASRRDAEEALRLTHEIGMPPFARRAEALLA